jgi:hypothetical protein
MYSALLMLFISAMGDWDLSELYDIFGEKAYIG